MQEAGILPFLLRMQLRYFIRFCMLILFYKNIFSNPENEVRASVHRRKCSLKVLQCSLLRK